MAQLTMTRAPLRVSFFGGGTDYPEYFMKNGGGAVLGTAIDKFSYITASTFLSNLFDYKVRISYRQVELVKDVAEIQHRVYREALKFCGLERDIELHNVADLPAFSGLGSSSTFTVALLQALHGYKGEVVKGIQLAYEAIHIERGALQDNVGCQDQTFAAVGGFNLLEFRREDDISVHRVPISPARIEELQSHLLLVFTNITRRASDVVAGQLKRIAQNDETLKKMRGMVDRGLQILTSAGSLTPFGELLHEAWLAKSSLAEGVSNDVISKMYTAAMENGAIGGKLLGAGGGGFLLLFAPPERHGKLRSIFSDKQEVKVRLNAPGSEIIL
jgi:D-glycero-alpha-D-manno-heptose-7-phosphate kinase